MDAQKYSTEGTFVVENVSVFQKTCSTLQDASTFQHDIQLHIYSVERHLKTFYFKKIKGSYQESRSTSADSFSCRWKGYQV